MFCFEHSQHAGPASKVLKSPTVLFFGKIFLKIYLNSTKFQNWYWGALQWKSTESNGYCCLIMLYRGPVLLMSYICFQIQNRRLLSLYQTNSRTMTAGNGESGLNEMTLFHGTTMNAAEDIIRHGFNRSFCRSSSLYGQGVYFAKEASLAATYSSQAFGSTDRWEYAGAWLLVTFRKLILR